MKHLRLPCDGELSESKSKKFREVVVFVHHVGGNKRTLLRHVKLVNELGFDAVRFNLRHANFNLADGLPISSSLRFGTRHIWTDQLESVLNAVPEKKIIFSLSMPSVAAIDAIARRGASDIRALVCDGGPFLSLIKCTWNLFSSEYRISNRFLRGAATLLSQPYYGANMSSEVGSSFAKFPENFPILSIRGSNDPLVPVDAIDALFAKAGTNVKLETYLVEDGGHLDGLKKQAAEYGARVGKFLRATATEFNS